MYCIELALNNKPAIYLIHIFNKKISCVWIGSDNVGFENSRDELWKSELYLTTWFYDTSKIKILDCQRFVLVWYLCTHTIVHHHSGILITICVFFISENCDVTQQTMIKRNFDIASHVLYSFVIVIQGRDSVVCSATIS